jgi:predicted ester cyclase
MSNESENEIIAGRWFTDFWGKTCNLGIVDELAAPDMLLQYSLREPRRGHADIKAFMTGLREAFPDLAFASTADLIAEGDYVVSRWEGGGTHIGLAFSDFLVGSLPAATGRKMRFTGTTVLRIENGKIAEDIGLDDGATGLQQLGQLIVLATAKRAFSAVSNTRGALKGSAIKKQEAECLPRQPTLKVHAALQIVR